MDSYYKKIRKKSIPSILLGIGMLGVSIYMIWDYTLGTNAHAKDHTAIAALFGALLLLGVFLLYNSLQSVQILKKNLKKLGVSESDIAEDLAKGREFTLCNIGRCYALKCSGKPDAILLEGALVVYPEVEIREKGGYSSYTYRVFVTERSGKEKCLEAGSQSEMEQIYDSIMEIVPYAVTQNDNVIKELRKKNLSELIRMVEQRKEKLETNKE